MSETTNHPNAIERLTVELQRANDQRRRDRARQMASSLHDAVGVLRELEALGYHPEQVLPRLADVAWALDTLAGELRVAATRNA